MGDFGSAGESIGLADKTFHGLPVFEDGAADSERRRHGGDEAAEPVFRYGPNFYFDSRSCKLMIADEPRFGRFGAIQGI